MSYQPSPHGVTSGGSYLFHGPYHQEAHALGAVPMCYKIPIKRIPDRLSQGTGSCALKSERSRYCTPSHDTVNVPDAGVACTAPPDKRTTPVPTLLLGCVMQTK